LAGLLALLEGMEAGQIASLELLDTPGAKYDADGTAGVINIVTKQPEDAGTAGSILVNAGYGLREKAGSILRLSHGKGGHYFSGSYGFRHDRTGFRLNGPGVLRLPLLGEGLVQTDYHNRNRGRLQSHNLQLDWEMKLPHDWRFGGAFSGQLTRNKYRIKITNSYLYPADSSFTAAIDILNPYRSTLYQPSLFLERSLPNGGILSLKADYLGFERENLTEVSNEIVGAEPEDNPAFSPQSIGAGNTEVGVIALQLDISGGKENQVGWAVGLKYAGSEANNGSRLSRLIANDWELEPRSLNELNSQEQLGAGYASLAWRSADRWQLDLAARYEYWQQRFSDDTPDRSRGRIFPTASASYRISDTRSFHLGYVRRIDRPAFEDLANNLTFSGLVSFFTGNPRLQPTLSNRLTLRYQHSPLQFSLAWQTEQDPIARYQIVEDLKGGFLLVTPQNVDFQRSLEGQVSGTFDLTDSWSLNGNANVATRHFRVSGVPFVFTNGAMAAEVEVDTDTGIVTVLHVWVVEDCGRVLNPRLVDEQIRGGVVQGIG
ncbi:MAG: TonB-dependent receptor, partial [Bacteroidota bacterium]